MYEFPIIALMPKFSGVTLEKKAYEEKRKDTEGEH
jgi:hypothetical protein